MKRGLCAFFEKMVCNLLKNGVKGSDNLVIWKILYTFVDGNILNTGLDFAGLWRLMPRE